MATSSEIKSGLDEISDRIVNARRSLNSAKTRIMTERSRLAALPADFADVVTEIGNFDPQTTDEFEKQAIAELAKLTTEFQALKGKAQGAETALSGIDFTT